VKVLEHGYVVRVFFTDAVLDRVFQDVDRNAALASSRSSPTEPTRAVPRAGERPAPNLSAWEDPGWTHDLAERRASFVRKISLLMWAGQRGW
jgi:hypothetical protein